MHFHSIQKENNSAQLEQLNQTMVIWIMQLEYWV